MCHYTYLTPFEREKILFFLAEGKSITEIAHLLKRSKSTISREFHRNAAPAAQPMSYCPLIAQALYKQRREACHPHKRLSMHLCTPTSKSASWSTTGRQRRRTDPVGAWLPSRQRSDDLPRYPRRPAEPARSFSEVRTSETTASRETASQERQRRTSWQVRHIALHRRASCQCSEPFRPWPLGSGYCGGQARKGMLRHTGGPEKPVVEKPRARPPLPSTSAPSIGARDQ